MAAAVEQLVAPSQPDARVQWDDFILERWASSPHGHLLPLGAQVSFQGTLVLITLLAINATMFVIEIVLGILSDSTALIADSMDVWLDELVPGNSSYTYQATPADVSGIGLTEAPRGALGHWIDINSEKKISRYQVITPTAWNASPRIGDASHQLGPIEQALIGTPVADENKPVELLRVVHSFDPCLACSVHLVRPHGKSEPVYVPLPTG